MATGGSPTPLLSYTKPQIPGPPTDNPDILMMQIGPSPALLFMTPVRVTLSFSLDPAATDIGHMFFSPPDKGDIFEMDV